MPPFMHTTRRALALAVLATLAACGGSGSDSPSPAPRYPATRTGDDATTHFGQRVADPYRWLEDTRSTPVIDWMRAQNAFSADYVEGQAIYPQVLARLQALEWPEFVAQPQAKRAGGAAVRADGLQQVGQQRQGRYYYQWRDLGRQEREGRQDDWRRRPAGAAGPLPGPVVDNRIYVSAGPGQAGQVLLDVGQLAQQEPGDTIALLGHQVSPDGRFLAYRLKRNHADLDELHLIDLRSPKPEPAVLTRTLAGEGFMFAEGAGLLYVAAENITLPGASSYGQQAIVRVDPAKSGDTEVLYRTEAARPMSLTLGPVLGGQLYFGRSADTSTSDVLRLDLAAPGAAQMVLDGQGRVSFQVMDAQADGRLLVVTTDGAAMYRLVSVDPSQPQGGTWRHVLPAQPGDVVSEAQLCGRYAYALKWRDGENRLERYALDGGSAPREIALPAPGAVLDLRCSEILGQPEDLDYMHSTLAQPGQYFRYEPEGDRVVLRGSLSYPGHDPQNYEVRALHAPAADGTQIPITLVHRKGQVLDGKAPALMYVYGGFMSPSPAYFDADVLPLLESGGVYVIAHVRGGAERGTAWYDAGRLLNKRTTYSDLADVARYLAAQGYTSAARLGVQGWSNGGTSSAAVALLYPELFAVSLPRVGVHDLTRYTAFTWGFSWTHDYGDPAVQAEFANLMAFSPLHSVQARKYPAMYVMTGQDDQRVLPAHSYKLAAALQNTATGPGPYLLHAFAKSGHGIEGERQRSTAHALTFFFTQTGAPFVAQK